MPEFKREIAKTDFKPTGTTIHGDAMAQFKSSAAQTIADTTMGIGAGYAAGTAERNIGADESDADASAYVQQAFQAAAPVKSGYAAFDDEAPSKEELEEQRQKFLNDAQLTHKRMLSAREQGIMGTRELNDRVVMDRKQVANDPFKAMFLPEYDKIMGGGASGSARGSYFGKTPQEKAQEKAYEVRATKQMEDKMKVERMVLANPKLSEDQAFGLLLNIEHEAMLAEASKNRIAIGKGTSTDRVNVFRRDQAAGPMQTLNKNAIALVKKGASGQEVNAFNASSTVAEAQTMAALRAMGLDGDVYDKEVTRIENEFKHLRKMVNDTDYAALSTEVTEHHTAEIADLVTSRARNIIKNSKAVQIGAAIDLLGKDLEKTMIGIMNMKTLYGSMERGTNPMLDMAFGFLEEDDLIQTGDDAVADIHGGGKGGNTIPALSAQLAGTILTWKGQAKISLKSHQADPEGSKERISQYSDLRLWKMLEDKDWVSAVKEAPDMGHALMEAAARNASVYQNQDGGEKPVSIKVIPPDAPNMYGASGQTYNPLTGQRMGKPSLWKFESLDEEGNKVKLNDKFKRNLKDVYKWAIESPEMWEGKYDNIDIFVETLFAYKKGGRQQILFNELVAAEEAAKLESALGETGGDKL